MIKDKKKFITFFLISFAITAIVVCFSVFVLFRGIFYNAYRNKGNTLFEKGSYTAAIDNYETARGWKGKKQEIYLLLAKSYCAIENYDSAAEIIDLAIDKKITTADSGLEELYTMRIQIMSASGDLSGAVQYIDNISDQYLIKKIQDIRPADLSYTPTQGSYDKTLKMEITVREGETVYYTTDGTYPTKYSNLYVEPINIGNGKTNITAVSVNTKGLVSPLLSVTYTVTNENETVVFDDSKIEQMVRAELSKPIGNIRIKELQSITSLNSYTADGYIKTLSDLDLMPNLEMLILDGETNMLSISQISGKTKLTHLSLSNCELDSTEINVLGGLTALETLDLSENDLTSISVLSNLTSLRYLYLNSNSITDISALSGASELIMLDASNNFISEIPDLSASTKLETLVIAGNTVSDLGAVHNLTGLIYLNISSNNIKNAKTLSALTHLKSLYISFNPIANFDFLTSTTSLKELDVSETSFVSTKVLTNLSLTYFKADNTGISSLNDLANSKELTTLSIANTNVTDLSPILPANSLDYLDISHCKISDLSSLSQFPALYTLCATDVNVTGIQFMIPDIMIVQ